MWHQWNKQKCQETLILQRKKSRSLINYEKETWTSSNPTKIVAVVERALIYQFNYSRFKEEKI